MNKFLIKKTYLIIFLAIAACSYKPIFAEREYNFEIVEIIFSGEKDINRIISNKLSLIKANDKGIKKKYNILINTKKRKKIISKDAQGNPLKFEYVLVVDYSIIENNKILLKRDIEKKYIYNNDADKFKLEQNEKIISDNLSGDIGDMIISSIINLNDS